MHAAASRILAPWPSTYSRPQSARPAIPSAEATAWTWTSVPHPTTTTVTPTPTASTSTAATRARARRATRETGRRARTRTSASLAHTRAVSTPTVPTSQETSPAIVRTDMRGMVWRATTWTSVWPIPTPALAIAPTRTVVSPVTRGARQALRSGASRGMEISVTLRTGASRQRTFQTQTYSSRLRPVFQLRVVSGKPMLSSWRRPSFPRLPPTGCSSKSVRAGMASGPASSTGTSTSKVGEAALPWSMAIHTKKRRTSSFPRGHSLRTEGSTL